MFIDLRARPNLDPPLFSQSHIGQVCLGPRATVLVIGAAPVSFGKMLSSREALPNQRLPNAPMSGAEARSAEASAPLAG